MPDAITAAEFAEALGGYAAGVTVLTIREDLDDLGTTVSAFMAVSAEPPLVAVGLRADSYIREALERSGTCAISVLDQTQAVLASRFAAAGRPSARLLLDDVEVTRAVHSNALLITEAIVGLDTVVADIVPAGDHVLVTLTVVGVSRVRPDRAPLLRMRGRYLPPR